MSDGVTVPSDATNIGAVVDAHRLEAFSDSVMAVIITIMAFDLKTPMTANWHGLEGRLPSFLVYILSFAFVGIYWNNHHHLLRATKRIDGAVMWANLHLLFWLSLIPFATSWVGAKHGDALPAAAYGVVALGSALAYFVLVRSILRTNRDDHPLVNAVKRRQGNGLVRHLRTRDSTGVRESVPFVRLLHGGRADLVRPRQTTDEKQLRRCAPFGGIVTAPATAPRDVFIREG
jgi:uncharacterized membrane protein